MRMKKRVLIIRRSERGSDRVSGGFTTGAEGCAQRRRPTSESRGNDADVDRCFGFPPSARPPLPPFPHFPSYVGRKEMKKRTIMMKTKRAIGEEPSVVGFDRIQLVRSSV